MIVIYIFIRILCNNKNAILETEIHHNRWRHYNSIIHIIKCAYEIIIIIQWYLSLNYGVHNWKHKSKHHNELTKIMAVVHVPSVLFQKHIINQNNSSLLHYHGASDNWSSEMGPLKHLLCSACLWFSIQMQHIGIEHFEHQKVLSNMVLNHWKQIVQSAFTFLFF